MRWKTNDSTLTTTDATATNIYSFTLDDDSAYIVETQVIGFEAGGAEVASYYLRGVFYRTGAGNATQEGSTDSVATDIESDGAWACVLQVSGGTAVRVRVTGDAANTVYWRAITTYTLVTDDS